MALAGRNDPCPCQSGKKYKRCCGFDRATERAAELKLEALEKIARLAYASPQLVPESDTFDIWVRALLAKETEIDVENGIRAIGDSDARRILEACADVHANRWPGLVEQVGDEVQASLCLLGSAVNAGIRDHRPVERQLAELAEGECKPGEALALCLDGEMLWSRVDGLAAERAVDAIPEWVDDEEYDRLFHPAIARVAQHHATEWHAPRLARIVRRVEAQLPFDGLESASENVRIDCARFATEETFRADLAATLLGDLVGRPLIESFRARLAA
ncbi:MAG: SEC-C domain-containing protein [Gaiellales bacterium]